MNLFINSPVYYTQEYGIVDEVYKMCLDISKCIDIKLYTDSIDTIGITPIIAPISVLNSEGHREVSFISLAYRMANISLVSDYYSFCNADIDVKKHIIIENVLLSLKVIKKKLKNNFDYERIEQDIKELVQSRGQSQGQSGLGQSGDG